MSQQPSRRYAKCETAMPSLTHFLFPVGLVLFGAIGCSQPEPSTVGKDRFPIRSDFLVVASPKAQPSSWYPPGFPYLQQLRTAMTRATRRSLELDSILQDFPPEVRALNQERESNNILDPRDPDMLFPEDRKAFAEALTRYFGTPSAPSIPPANQEVAQTILELQLDDATLFAGSQVYNNYCLTCHGLTGDGNGPTAAQLQPLPRDFRQGIFKFISTDPDIGGAKPRRSDLRRSLIHGMDGAGMPSFAGLPEADLEAVISYVIFLSLRGQSEYETIKLLFIQQFLPDLDPEADRMFRTPIEKEIHNQLTMLSRAWRQAEAHPIPMEPDPFTTEEEILEAAGRGYNIFVNAKLGGCTACHVGYGKNALLNFDSWGGVAQARNLLTGTMRGGRSPEDIYTRLYTGINGSGMPSFRTTLMPTQTQRSKGQHPLWETVHFVRALSDPAKRRYLKEAFAIDDLGE